MGDSTSAPKVFVSHASADKDRFVTAFASRLRGAGVDAWFAEWEIAPGDSLVDRIFDEGIGSADVFILVVSDNSASSKWVHEECNAGFVRRVEGQCRLIPVVLDGVAVPEALKSTVWQTISDPVDYDDEFDAIVRAIFGHTTKPPLGAPPAYTSTDVAVNGLPVDMVTVMGLLVDTAIVLGHRFLGNLDDERAKAAAVGISSDGFAAAIARLAHEDYIDVTMMYGTRVSHCEITWLGLLTYLKASPLDVDEVGAAVATHLVNTDDRDFDHLIAAVGQPRLIVELVLESFDQQGLVSISRAMGNVLRIHSVSPALATML